MKAKLISPKETAGLSPEEVNWEGCEYSKCGRTDKGVSAFGQVIGVRVRSNRPLKKLKKVNVKKEGEEGVPRTAQAETDPEGLDMGSFVGDDDDSFDLMGPPLSPSRSRRGSQQSYMSEPEEEHFDPIDDELPYPSILNRLLPPDIRILAWCPCPPSDFSARHSCRERRYRYFFTQPAFAPSPNYFEQANASTTKIKDGWLDIEAMRTAARAYEGVHDFRNFCKVDPSKQNRNYERRIFHADIEEVADHTGSLSHMSTEAFLPHSSTGIVGNSPPKVYTFTLYGSAFLWHQVRHMVSVLFLVGQGLESPSIVPELLDVEKNPRRPTYEMATDTPLVLWDCIFPHEDDEERKDAMQWVYLGDGVEAGPDKYGTGGVVDDLWKVWRERKIDEMLAGQLIDIVARQGKVVAELTAPSERKGPKSQRVFDGGDKPRLQGVYIPVMKKPLLDDVEAINEKYAVKKGFESSASMRDAKQEEYRRRDKALEEAKT